MGKMSWAVLQRLFDDEPPLRVWREERGFPLSELAVRAGINEDRLIRLDEDLRSATDAEIDKLCVALRLPLEFLFVAPAVDLARN